MRERRADQRIECGQCLGRTQILRDVAGRMGVDELPAPLAAQQQGPDRDTLQIGARIARLGQQQAVQPARLERVAQQREEAHPGLALKT